MIELGILADDLTGGMMVASLLEREGIECPLVSPLAGLLLSRAVPQRLWLWPENRLIKAASAAQEASKQSKLSKRSIAIVFTTSIVQHLIQPKRVISAQ